MVPTHIRNNGRVIIDDEELALCWLGRAHTFLPRVVDNNTVIGFNERFRFYRYKPGQIFKAHRDGSFDRRKPLEFSLVTFMV